MSDPAATTPDYMVVGHISKDLLPGGDVALGGTATYSALAAQKLGLQAAVVTSCATEDAGMLDLLRDAGIWLKVVPSHLTTSFSNRYDGAGRRTQVLNAHATGLGLDDVPLAWRSAPILHLGPIAQELRHDLPQAFTKGLLGITPQGWMRTWDTAGRVTHSAYPVPTALKTLPPNAFLVLSTEDLGGNATLITEYLALARLTAITQGAGEAYMALDDALCMVPAQLARSIDPTGAGDVFAAALFTRYIEIGDLCEAALFAHAAAACAIEGQGVAAMPDRETVERRRG